MVKRLRKRAISIVLMLTMVFTLFPTTAINAYAAEDNTEYSQLMDQQEDETVSESEDGFVSDENEEITDPEESETEDSSEDLFDDDTESVEESLEEDLTDEEIPEEELIEEGSSKLLGLEPGMGLMAQEEVSDVATPLTLEAKTAGTIVVKNPKSGMKYSVDGGEKTTVNSTGDLTIDVNVGQKVSFYGNGTDISCYGDSKGNSNDPTSTSNNN